MSQDELETIAELPGLGALKTAVVGSTYILGTGKDFDLLVLVEDLRGMCARILSRGFSPDSEHAYDDAKFASFRKGRVNVLVTADPMFFDKFALAAEVCKVLKLTVREDRIKVHAVIRDGRAADSLAPSLP